MLEAIPVVGPAVKGFAQELAAGLKSVTNGTSFEKELAGVKGAAQKAEEENPVATTIGKVQGNVLPMAGVAGTGIGARLLGLVGETLPRMAGAGALSGAGINAADAIARGQDPTTAALFGGAGGVLLPAAGRAAGGVFNVFRPVASSPAATELAAASERLGINVPRIASPDSSANGPACRIGTQGNPRHRQSASQVIGENNYGSRQCR